MFFAGGGVYKKNNIFYILEQMKIEIEYEESTYSQWTQLQTLMEFENIF